LRLVDRLISEGHSPTHFARQMVRFLRNTVVAKIAGGDSSLLQISGDERARVARVAELFSEEDLARHLQIMLRTHGELGYRQEQRFHLELGLLKMSHAQRLLPIEELLSAAGVAGASSPRPSGRPTVVPDQRKPESSATARANQVSPFAADSARKGGTKPQLLTDDNAAADAPVFATGRATANVIMGAAAPAAVAEATPVVSAGPESIPEKQTVPTDAMPDEALRVPVLNALAAGGHQMLVSMLEGGQWQVEGNELVVKVASSATVIDMTLGADARRLVIATASGVAGRALKLKVIPGNGAVGPTTSRPSSNGGRSRAEQDPIVRRMKEKFGAEIRTIIDYKERR
jgi:DNA polymerase-3 subunit gamma/tau